MIVMIVMIVMILVRVVIVIIVMIVIIITNLSSGGHSDGQAVEDTTAEKTLPHILTRSES